MSKRAYGKQTITHEMMEALLVLPDELSIDTFNNNPSRKVLEIYYSSDKVIPNYTDIRGEGQSIINSSVYISNAEFVAKLREIADKIESQLTNQTHTSNITIMENLLGQMREN